MKQVTNISKIHILEKEVNRKPFSTKSQTETTTEGNNEISMFYQLECQIKKNKLKQPEAPLTFSVNRFKLANNEMLSETPLSKLNNDNNSTSNIKKRLNTMNAPSNAANIPNTIVDLSKANFFNKVETKKEIKKSVLSKSITFNSTVAACSNPNDKKSQNRVDRERNNDRTEKKNKKDEKRQNNSNSLLTTDPNAPDPTSTFYSRLLCNLKLEDKQILSDEFKEREKLM